MKPSLPHPFTLNFQLVQFRNRPGIVTVCDQICRVRQMNVLPIMSQCFAIITFCLLNLSPHCLYSSSLSSTKPVIISHRLFRAGNITGIIISIRYRYPIDVLPRYSLKVFVNIIQRFIYALETPCIQHFIPKIIPFAGEPAIIP